MNNNESRSTVVVFTIIESINNVLELFGIAIMNTWRAYSPTRKKNKKRETGRAKAGGTQHTNMSSCATVEKKKRPRMEAVIQFAVIKVRITSWLL